MISDDEYLERIVAGIHSVSSVGADVHWNETINGRQFDVVVRFKLGTLQYLVVVEVKNRVRKTEAADIEAFVTKARDQLVNKTVFVTVAGFQQGAIDVAKRHGVDLFTVTFDESQFALPSQASFIRLRKKGAPKDVPSTLSVGEPRPIATIERAILVYANGNEYVMPDERSQMNYYCQKTTFSDGSSLDDLFQRSAIPNVQSGERKQGEIKLRPQRIFPPDDYYFPKGKLNAIKYEVVGRMGRPVRGNTQIDPNVFTLPVIYRNILTGEETRFTLDQLPLGPKRVEAGKFYFITHPLMYYYCESTVGDSIRWFLIESFQNGDLLRSTTTQNIKYSAHYIPVTDKEILKRLRRRLRDYLKLIR